MSDQAYGKRVQVSEGNAERLPQREDYQHQAHDDATRHHLPHVPTRTQRGFGYIGGRTQKIVGRPQHGAARSHIVKEPQTVALWIHSLEKDSVMGMPKVTKIHKSSSRFRNSPCDLLNILFCGNQALKVNNYF